MDNDFHAAMDTYEEVCDEIVDIIDSFELTMSEIDIMMSDLHDELEETAKHMELCRQQFLRITRSRRQQMKHTAVTTEL